MARQDQTKNAMDRMYRWTRHVYDASRKYFLLGRDNLIEKMQVKAGEQICEVGCGTARNLIKMARLHPQGQFYGVDISDEMLKTARRAVEWAKLDIPLRQGFAENFDPQALFKLDKPLDKIVFSYTLSIIPPWKESIDHSLEVLADDGKILIVDFSGMSGMPGWFQKLIFWWLSKFHVYYKPEILEYLRTLVEEGKGTLNVKHLYNGYAYKAVFQKSYANV